MNKAVQFSALFIYLFTSCFLIGANKWTTHTNSQKMSLAEVLFSTLTIEVNVNSEADNDLVFLFKDPSDDGTIVLEYFPSISIFEYTSRQRYFYTVEKSDDPLLNIFSPPPQFS